MHRSQSITHARSPKKQKKQEGGESVNHDIADRIVEKCHLSEDNFYAEVENCALRISVRLREIDNLDLGMHEPGHGQSAVEEENAEDSSEDSGSGDGEGGDDPREADQKHSTGTVDPHRAQALAGEHLLRSLHSQRVNKDMVALDERSTLTARNFKRSLRDMGISEHDLLETDPVQTAPLEMSTNPIRSHSVRIPAIIHTNHTNVLTPAAHAPNIRTPLREGLGRNTVNEEYDEQQAELHGTLEQFMRHAFPNGDNDLNTEVARRWASLRQGVTGATRQLVAARRREVQQRVQSVQRDLSHLESAVQMLVGECEDADARIALQGERVQFVRQLVEEKLSRGILRLEEQGGLQEVKHEEQVKEREAVRHWLQQMRDMYNELQGSRLFADPFVRRRAKLMVSGQLQHLAAQDLVVQEEREKTLGVVYAQWRELSEDCGARRGQIKLLEQQQLTFASEIALAEACVVTQRQEYRDRAMALADADEQVEGRLKLLQDRMEVYAQADRRRLELVQQGRDLRQQAKERRGHGSKKSKEDRLQRRFRLRARDGAGGDRTEPGRPRRVYREEREARRLWKSGDQDRANRDIDCDSDSGSSSGSSAYRKGEMNGPGMELSGQGQATGLKRKARTRPLCDPQTEAVLGVTAEHAKRQEIHTVRTVGVAVRTQGGAQGGQEMREAHEALLQIHAERAAHRQASKQKGLETQRRMTRLIEDARARVGRFVAMQGALQVKSDSPTPEVVKQREVVGGEVQVRGSVLFDIAGHGARPGVDVDVDAEMRSVAAGLLGAREQVAALEQKSEKALQALGGSSTMSRRSSVSSTPHLDDSSSNSSDESDTDNKGPHAPTHTPRHKGVAVHSMVGAACYVALYTRYLHKFPNLRNLQNPQRTSRGPSGTANAPYSTQKVLAADRPRPVGLPGHESEAGETASNHSNHSDDSASLDDSDHKERNGLNSQFTFSLREGVVVVKEALDSLLRAGCVDKITVIDALEQISFLERVSKMVALSANSLPQEESEMRFQMHFLCISLVRRVLEVAPRLLLVANSRRLFLEVLLALLALAGVVLNCSLPFWQPRAPSNGDIATQNVEHVAAHLLELMLTMGDKGSKAPPTGSSRSSRSRRGRGENPPGAPGFDEFLTLLRTYTAELLTADHVKEWESAKSTKSKPGSLRQDKNKDKNKDKNTGEEEAPTVDLHDVFELLNRTADGAGQGAMRYRHGILGLQLFLQAALGGEFSLEEVVLKMRGGIRDAEGGLGGRSGDVSHDLDDLLQRMEPKMVPAMLALEMFRRVLEEEVRRVALLGRLVQGGGGDLAELQFLNTGQAVQFDAQLT
ncbi:hypothetical protein B484DRAFT_481842, partial [Ochromonadaceae sp. CCMP2298]